MPFFSPRAQESSSPKPKRGDGETPKSSRPQRPSGRGAAAEMASVSTRNERHLPNSVIKGDEWMVDARADRGGLAVLDNNLAAAGGSMRGAGGATVDHLLVPVAVTSGPIPSVAGPSERWRPRVFGPPGTLQFRLILLDQHDRVASPWHDVPLYTLQGHLNFVCLTPRGGWTKLEVSAAEDFCPLKLARRLGQPAHYARNVSWNYGMIPQTWASAEQPNEEFGGLLYDNKPVECIEVGSRSSHTGEVYAVKPLGAFAMVEAMGRLSWKLVAIATSDELAPVINNEADLKAHMPGVIDSMREWLRACDYIGPGDPRHRFGLNERMDDASAAIQVIAQTHDSWQLLTDLLPRSRGQAPAGEQRQHALSTEPAAELHPSGSGSAGGSTLAEEPGSSYEASWRASVLRENAYPGAIPLSDPSTSNVERFLELEGFSSTAPAFYGAAASPSASSAGSSSSFRFLAPADDLPSSRSPAGASAPSPSQIGLHLPSQPPSVLEEASGAQVTNRERRLTREGTWGAVPWRKALEDVKSSDVRQGRQRQQHRPNPLPLLLPADPASGGSWPSSPSQSLSVRSEPTASPRARSRLPGSPSPASSSVSKSGASSNLPRKRPLVRSSSSSKKLAAPAGGCFNLSAMKAQLADEGVTDTMKPDNAAAAANAKGTGVPPTVSTSVAAREIAGKRRGRGSGGGSRELLEGGHAIGASSAVPSEQPTKSAAEATTLPLGTEGGRTQAEAAQQERGSGGGGDVTLGPVTGAGPPARAPQQEASGRTAGGGFAAGKDLHERVNVEEGGVVVEERADGTAPLRGLSRGANPSPVSRALTPATPAAASAPALEDVAPGKFVEIEARAQERQGSMLSSSKTHSGETAPLNGENSAQEAPFPSVSQSHSFGRHSSARKHENGTASIGETSQQQSGGKELLPPLSRSIDQLVSEEHHRIDQTAKEPLSAMLMEVIPAAERTSSGQSGRPAWPSVTDFPSVSPRSAPTVESPHAPSDTGGSQEYLRGDAPAAAGITSKTRGAPGAAPLSLPRKQEADEQVRRQQFEEQSSTPSASNGAKAGSGPASGLADHQSAMGAPVSLPDQHTSAPASHEISGPEGAASVVPLQALLNGLLQDDQKEPMDALLLPHASVPLAGTQASGNEREGREEGQGEGHSAVPAANGSSIWPPHLHPHPSREPLEGVDTAGKAEELQEAPAAQPAATDSPTRNGDAGLEVLGVPMLSISGASQADSAEAHPGTVGGAEQAAEQSGLQGPQEGGTSEQEDPLGRGWDSVPSSAESRAPDALWHGGSAPLPVRPAPPVGGGDLVGPVAEVAGGGLGSAEGQNRWTSPDASSLSPREKGFTEGEHGETATQAKANATSAATASSRSAAEEGGGAALGVKDVAEVMSQSCAAEPSALVTMISLAAGMAPQNVTEGAAAPLEGGSDDLDMGKQAGNALAPRGQSLQEWDRSPPQSGGGALVEGTSGADGPARADGVHTPGAGATTDPPVAPAATPLDGVTGPDASELFPEFSTPSQSPSGDASAIVAATRSPHRATGSNGEGQFRAAPRVSRKDMSEDSATHPPGVGSQSADPGGGRASPRTVGSWAHQPLLETSDPAVPTSEVPSQQSWEASSGTRTRGKGANGEEGVSGDDFSGPEEVEAEMTRPPRRQQRRVAAAEPAAGSGGQAGARGSGDAVPAVLQHERSTSSASNQSFEGDSLPLAPGRFSLPVPFDELVVEVEAQVHLVEDEEERKGNPAAIEAKSRRNSPPLTRGGSGPFSSLGFEEYVPDPELEFYQEGGDLDIPTAEVVEHDDYHGDGEQEDGEEWGGDGWGWGPGLPGVPGGQDRDGDSADMVLSAGRDLDPWSGAYSRDAPPPLLAGTAAGASLRGVGGRSSAGLAAALGPPHEQQLSYSVSDFERGLAYSSAAHLDETLDLAAAKVPETKEKDWAEAMAKVSNILGRSISIRVDSPRASTPESPSPLVDLEGKARSGSRPGSARMAPGSGSGSRSGSAPNSAGQRTAGEREWQSPSGTSRWETGGIGTEGEVEDSLQEDERSLTRSFTDYSQGRRKTFVIDSQDFQLWKERKRALKGGPVEGKLSEGTRRDESLRLRGDSPSPGSQGPASMGPFSGPARHRRRADVLHGFMAPFSPGAFQVSNSFPDLLTYNPRQELGATELAADGLLSTNRHLRGASVPEMNLVVSDSWPDRGKSAGGPIKAGGDLVPSAQGSDDPSVYRRAVTQPAITQSARRSADVSFEEDLGKVELLRGPHTGLHIIQTTTLNDRDEWENR